MLSILQIKNSLFSVLQHANVNAVNIHDRFGKSMTISTFSNFTEMIFLVIQLEKSAQVIRFAYVVWMCTV